ncbi:DUF805 domain-containing protein [Compostimonas suwonensis]|uniref:Uncharacterized membrane protein YhaH (DUF805 family) n=1 Tax=Compostimonas suwonensis TaxID=1048394 RepID=A0A2M9BB66_9MICO|nr:DUF805 domain-containing protein [Compostimonas suwonensis]PJJ55190.1 uncharacterized membrane protein YhaH (DUF805 family) [Compostimonas suwonensis]
MTFGTAISTVFRKYVDFFGRATRSEYWWWYLFVLIVNVAVQLVASVLPDGARETVQWLSYLWSLAILLPTLAVGARRLHDSNHSAFHLFWMLLPLIGWIILLVFFLQPSNPAGARFDRPGTAPAVA